ncbi:hypothetical protein [Ramlibacter montanisoli]|nr:hypothetical protein [Ramlibacter montanisoli]
MLVLLVLAGCAASPPSYPGSSHCATRPGSYQCQIEQYMRV